MSSTEDDDVMIKLDANIEVETVVRNRFEEYEDLCYNDPFSNHYSVSSDDEMVETSVESSQTSTEFRDLDTTASAGSDASETYTSAVSDVSAESTDSMPVDVAMDEILKEPPASPPQQAAHFLESRLKYVNCKELIVFCIDMSSDMEKVPYVVTDESDERGEKNSFSKESGESFVEESDERGEKNSFLKESGDSFIEQSDEPHSSKMVNQAKHSPLSLIKRAISMFVHNKHFIDKKHEYALMVLYDAASWVCEFTNSPNQLVDALEDLTQTVECNYCDLSSIISLLSEKYPFILSNEFQPLDGHRLLRVILIYGRANCEIVFSDPNAKEILMENPSLFLDIVYVHEPPSEENKCVEIYDGLCSLDDKDKSYIFETTRSVTSLHNAMGRLLGHPYQRPPQKNANYRLQDIVPEEQQRHR